MQLSGTRIFVGENTFLVQRQFNPWRPPRPSRRHLEPGSSARGTFVEAGSEILYVYVLRSKMTYDRLTDPLFRSVRMVGVNGRIVTRLLIHDFHACSHCTFFFRGIEVIACVSDRFAEDSGRFLKYPRASFLNNFYPGIVSRYKIG